MAFGNNGIQFSQEETPLDFRHSTIRQIVTLLITVVHSYDFERRI